MYATTVIMMLNRRSTERFVIVRIKSASNSSTLLEWSFFKKWSTFVPYAEEACFLPWFRFPFLLFFLLLLFPPPFRLLFVGCDDACCIFFSLTISPSNEASPSWRTDCDAWKLPFLNPTYLVVDAISVSIKCCASLRPLVHAPAIDASCNQSPQTPTENRGSQMKPVGDEAGVGSPFQTFKGTAAPHNCIRASQIWLRRAPLPSISPRMSFSNESTKSRVTFCTTSSGRNSCGALFFFAKEAVERIVQTSRLSSPLSSL